MILFGAILTAFGLVVLITARSAASRNRRAIQRYEQLPGVRALPDRVYVAGAIATGVGAVLAGLICLVYGLVSG